jgi:hypothetical protein
MLGLAHTPAPAWRGLCTLQPAGQLRARNPELARRGRQVAVGLKSCGIDFAAFGRSHARTSRFSHFELLQQGQAGTAGKGHAFEEAHATTHSTDEAMLSASSEHVT